MTDPEQSPSEKVIAAVAASEGVDPVDIEVPLFEVVDPDALNSLFGAAADGQIRFGYLGYDVTVHANGRVDVR